MDTKIFRPGRYDPYFLCPGRILFFKRQDIIIRAFRMFKKRIGGFRLVIAGGLAERDKDYMKYLKSLAGRDKDIVFMTGISEKEYVNLYRHCFWQKLKLCSPGWKILGTTADHRIGRILM